MAAGMKRKRGTDKGQVEGSDEGRQDTIETPPGIEGEATRQGTHQETPPPSTSARHTAQDEGDTSVNSSRKLARAGSQAEAPARSASKKSAGSHWPEGQLKTLRVLYELKDRNKWTWNRFAEEFNKINEVTGHPLRDANACRARCQRDPELRKNTEPKLTKWTPEQEAFLTAEKKAKTSNRDIYAKYLDKVQAHGWASREYKTVMTKLSSISERDSSRKSNRSSDQGTATDRQTLTMARRVWHPDEDAVLMKALHAHKDEGAAICHEAIQSELLALGERDGVPIGDRTIVAINKRLNTLRDGKPEATKLPRRWTDKDDQQIRQAMKQEKRKRGQAIKELSAALEVSEFAVRRRWKELKVIDKEVGGSTEEKEASPGQGILIEPFVCEANQGGATRPGKTVAHSGCTMPSAVLAETLLALRSDNAEVESVAESGDEILFEGVNEESDDDAPTNDPVRPDEEDVDLAVAQALGEVTAIVEYCSQQASEESKQDTDQGMSGQAENLPTTLEQGDGVRATDAGESLEDSATVTTGTTRETPAPRETETHELQAPGGSVREGATDETPSIPVYEGVPADTADVPIAQASSKADEVSDHAPEVISLATPLVGGEDEVNSLEGLPEATQAGVNSLAEVAKATNLVDLLVDPPSEVISLAKEPVASRSVVNSLVPSVGHAPSSLEDHAAESIKGGSHEIRGPQDPPHAAPMIEEDEVVWRNAHDGAPQYITVRIAPDQSRKVLSADTCDRLRASDLAPDSKLRMFYKDSEQRVQDMIEGGLDKMRLPDGPAPPVDKCLLRELMLAGTILSRGEESRAIFLREMWTDKYGECRDKDWCLAYDVNRPHFQYEGECRHWRYFKMRRVNFDYFTSVRDYLLAGALATHLEMLYATEGPDLPPIKRDAQCVRLRLSGGSMTNQMSGEWPGGGSEGDEQGSNGARSVTHLQPLLCSMTTLYLSLDMTMDQQVCEAQLSPWDYGAVVAGERYLHERQVLGRGVLMRSGSRWFIVTNASITSAQPSRLDLMWVPRTSLLNYVRRFLAIDQAASRPTPLVAALAMRDMHQKERPRPQQTRAKRVRMWTKSLFLRPSQMRVVEEFVTKTGIMLVRGPFGCGKTTTLTRAISVHREAYPKEVIAVVSETNAAIDEDLRRLRQKNLVPEDEILRLGKCDAHMQEFAGIYLDELMKKRRALIERIYPDRPDMVASEMKKYEDHLLARAKVLVATLATMGSAKYQHLANHVVIIDEGAQVAEAAVIQALREDTHTLLLAGDPNQLRGYSSLPTNFAERFPGDERRHKLNWSVFHTFEHCYASYGMKFPGLTTEDIFRCGPDLVTLLQPFYDYPLRSAISNTPGYLVGMLLPPLQDDASWSRDGIENGPPLPRGPSAIWLDSGNEGFHPDGRRKSASEEKFVNVIEQALVMELIMRIKAQLKLQSKMTHRVWRKSILVISPYAEQVKRLKEDALQWKNLYENFLDVEVKTVDSSQGCEADITITLMVRHVKMGFLKNNPSRLLVSLSRAKEYMFVLADDQTLAQDSTWAKFRQQAIDMRITYGRSRWTPEEAGAVLKDKDHMRKLASANDSRVIGDAQNAVLL